MKLKYKTSKGNRVKSFIPRSCGITTFDGYWWHYELNRWVPCQPNTPGEKSSHYNVRHVKSAKAFVRLLKQWSKYLPSGVEFILVSRYDLFNIHGKIGL